MIHVLLLSQYFPPDINGSSTRAYNAAKGLVSQGYDVTVISTFPHFPTKSTDEKYSKKLHYVEEKDGFKIIRMWIPSFSHSSNLKRSLLHLSFCFAAIVGSIFVKHVDIIFAMNPSFFVGLPAAIYRIIFRSKIIRNVDDLWPEVFYDLKLIKSDLVKKILNFMSFLSYKVSSDLIPISDGYVDTLVKKYNFPKNRIHVIEHGVDTSIFKPIKNPNSLKKIIMYSGAINIGYDFEPVIKAASELNDFPIKFIIKGIGDKIPELDMLIKKYDAKNVEVNTTILDLTSQIEFLNTADFFLLPMSSGVIDSGLPTKVLEYQALGKPILCISDGESGNYIKRTQSGIVVPTKNAKKVKESIIQLLSNKEESDKLGQNGLNYINNYLTIDKIGIRLAKIIDKLKDK